MFLQVPIVSSVVIVPIVSNVVIVPIIWLYITVFVFELSFSIMVSCTFIYSMLVIVGNLYSKICSGINNIIILFDFENISFDASLFMYI